MSHHDTERLIEEFLGERPHADEWQSLREGLEERLRLLRQQRLQESEQGADADRLEFLDKQIVMTDRELATFETEEAVTRFMEDMLLCAFEGDK